VPGGIIVPAAPPIPLIRLGNLFPQRQVYAKCEFLAPSGSFKTRGALHLLERLRGAGAPERLVVPSMGNTAIGVGVHAPAYGFKATAVVPQTIGRAKDERLQALGVELIKVAGGGTDVLHRATEVAAERQAYFVHPHLDPLWTDGYQAIAEEVLHELPGCRTLVFPVGGGGLLMGLTEYLRHDPAKVRLVGCEAYNYPTYAPFTHARTATVADGLILEEPHPAVRERIDAVGLSFALVPDADIRRAMAGVYQRQALVVEPSSAITVALVEAARDEVDEPVCVILTGQNISRDDFDRLIAV
jgi:threonine dehydratase